MSINADAVARELAQLYKTEFGGQKTGRYKISKANLRALANGASRLENGTLHRIIDSAIVNHDLLLIPLDGPLEMASVFGLLKNDPDWRVVPNRVVAAQPAS